MVTCRSGPGGYCAKPEASPTAGAPGGPALHIVRYAPAAVPLGANGAYTASVPIPKDGNFTAFFVSVKFADGHHATTQMGVAPATYPYEPCTAYTPYSALRK